MNFLNKQTNKYSKIINEVEKQQSHITECQIPKPCKDTYVFRDSTDTLIIKNNEKFLEYTQFNKNNHLIELSTLDKSSITKFSLEIVENSIDTDNFCYDCIIYGKSGVMLDLNDLPYEPAIALYNFISLHTQPQKEVEKKVKEKQRKKVTFADEIEELKFPNTPKNEIYSPEESFEGVCNTPSKNLKQSQLSC